MSQVRVIDTEIVGCKIIESKMWRDDRGRFVEAWTREISVAAGIEEEFVQDNQSRSKHGVLRGMHYQLHEPQGKLIRVVRGQIVDVAIDLRKSSSSFGVAVALEMTDEIGQNLWIPKGCAHGFVVLSEIADVVYKCTAPYRPEYERTLFWADPVLASQWPPAVRRPIVSARDAMGASWIDCDYFE